MELLEANNETVCNNNSNQPGSVENSHSPSVQYETVTTHEQYETVTRDQQYETVTRDQQYETVTRDQQYETVTRDQQYETVTRGQQYETVATHQQYESIVDTKCDQTVYNTLDHIDEVATQDNQLVANVDSYKHLQPVVSNDAEVHALPTVSINSTGTTAAAQGGTLSSSWASAQDDYTPHILPSTAQSNEDRPRLPTLRVNNQSTSDTSFLNLKLPFRLRLLGQFQI
jgi:hypothetical protein